MSRNHGGYARTKISSGVSWLGIGWQKGVVGDD
jgi:hypothetical protein